MTLAWEVTVDDIALVLVLVLVRQGVKTDAEQIFDDHFCGDAENCGQVERAALAYTDFDQQCDAALDEITAILNEAGVLPRPADT